MTLVHNSNPVLDPEVALGAGQRVALQVDAQSIKGLIHPYPELTGSGLEEPTDAANSVIPCDPAQ